MLSKHPPPKVPRWRITLLTTAEEIGTVAARDADEAIRVAIRQFGISKPEHQKRLAARRIT
jgi:hypothetical protein